MKKFAAVVSFFLPVFFPGAGYAHHNGVFPENGPVTMHSGKDTVKTGIKAIARHYGDSIVVRWAPANSASWLLLQENGYVIRKTVLSVNSKKEYQIMDTSSFIVKPFALNQWAEYYGKTSDTLAAVAAQLAYGKSNEANTGKEELSFQSLIEKRDEQTNRFTFALLLADFKPAIADGLGLRYVEKNVNKHYDYFFSVEPAPRHDFLLADTGHVIVRPNDLVRRDTATPVTAIGGDKIVFLFWEKTSPDKTSFTGYFIERSEDGKHFVRLNEFPYLPQANEDDITKPWRYNDSVAINYKNYYYRISGINAFGDISHSSNIVAVSGRDLEGPEAAVITDIRNPAGQQKIHLKWEKKLKEPDLQGYIIARGHTITGPYEPLVTSVLPAAAEEYTDESPVSGLPNYYVVVALDTAGNTTHSTPAYIQLGDLTPPAKPAGLTGMIDSAGRVLLQWDKGKEPDLAGYKVFFANAGDHIFTPLTGNIHQDTAFVDSIELRTLSKRIYYQIIAYDRAMNASEASDILELQKPDIVSPTAAVIHSFVVSDTSLLLKWYPSPSKDAARQEIYRRPQSASDWGLIAALPPGDSVFTDTSVEAGNGYEYAIETTDSSGLVSGKSFALEVYIYETGIANGIVNLNVVYDNEKRAVTLLWNKPEKAVMYYILYKEINGNGLTLFGNIRGGDTSYSEVLLPGHYRYALRAVYANGRESALSDIVPVTVR